MRIRALAFVAVSVAILMSAPCADAAFSGRNGRLVFELTGLVSVRRAVLQPSYGKR